MKRTTKPVQQPHKGSKSRNNNTTAIKCPVCNTNHGLNNCEEFLAMGTNHRNGAISNLRLRRNCLFSHGEPECISQPACKLCQKVHHSLLHESETTQATRKANPTPAPSICYGVRKLILDSQQVMDTTLN